MIVVSQGHLKKRGREVADTKFFQGIRGFPVTFEPRRRGGGGRRGKGRGPLFYGPANAGEYIGRKEKKKKKKKKKKNKTHSKDSAKGGGGGKLQSDDTKEGEKGV